MATKKGLRRHVSMHKPKAEPVTCEICKKVCASQARLALHQKTHNKPKERPPREYLCHICSKVYPSNSSLTYHMRTHTGIKPHVCKTCNSGFTTTTSLANHIRIHTGDRPFVCHVCSAAFAVSSAFRYKQQIYFHFSYSKMCITEIIFLQASFNSSHRRSELSLQDLWKSF